jgi:alkaline phosphatase
MVKGYLAEDGMGVSRQTRYTLFNQKRNGEVRNNYKFQQYQSSHKAIQETSIL